MALKLYSNLICPFAHRAHLTILEKALDFTFVKVPLSGEIKKNPHLSKPEHFLRHVNPKGTVPAIEHRIGGATHAVTESDVVAAYLQDAFPASGTPLRPVDPVLIARMNQANKHFSASPFYALLKNQDAALDADKAAALEKHLEEWIGLGQQGQAGAAADGGPVLFVCGAHFTLADIQAWPFLDRFQHTLRHFRGYDVFAGDEPWRVRLWAWYSAVAQRESAKQTSQQGEFYINAYANYAGARGVSDTFSDDRKVKEMEVLAQAA